MNTKALKVLEFDKIINRLAGFAVSPMGKNKASALVPFTELDQITHEQAATSEAASMILKKASLPLGGIRDIREAVKRSLMGGTLTIQQLMEVSECLYVFQKLKSYHKTEGRAERYTHLDPLFESVTTFQSVEREIARCIRSETEIDDNASVKLSQIRKEIKNSQGKIKDALNNIVHSSQYKNMLQDQVVTMRNDRYCVPVKLEYKNAFNGMIHDQSATGATVFMEPMSVVQLNNKIRDLYAQEKEEIERILYKLSMLVAEQGDLILTNMEIVSELDFIFAKGELALSMHATKPDFNQDGVIDIKKARHPLLDPDTVVHTDIYLGTDFHVLLITGPNTGGKTVTLKTIGLFTLMGQAGLHIPAFDHSKLAVFDDVFADIGDEQSIEQSLSTFSSHMKNIVGILEAVTANSLVLLDELGAGTDPTEGAALAISILQTLHRRGIRTAVTTHYSELKVYALSTDGVENASCEFDVVSLRPTYKLLIGIPGKSNAFAISRRLGLSESIIEEAKELISKENEKFEDVITDLEISRKSVLLEQEKAESYRIQAERMKEELQKQKDQLAKQKEKLLLKAKEEAREIVAKAKDEADQIIKELNRAAREGVKQNELNEQRSKLSDSLSKLDEDIYHNKKAPATHKPPKALRPGDRVHIISFNQKGTALTKPDQDGMVMVQAGIMKMKVPVKDLRIDTSQPEVNYKSAGGKIKAGKSQRISSEVDLRGMLTDEAVMHMEKYLDDAYLARMESVTIIHGKGTGAVRAAVQKSLKRNAHVKSFRLGNYGEGEHGVTIVELKL